MAIWVSREAWSGRPVAAHALPRADRELDAAVVAVAGVGGPVAAGLALGEAIPCRGVVRVVVAAARGVGRDGGGRRRRGRRRWSGAGEGPWSWWWGAARSSWWSGARPWSGAPARRTAPRCRPGRSRRHAPGGPRRARAAWRRSGTRARRRRRAAGRRRRRRSPDRSHRGPARPGRRAGAVGERRAAAGWTSGVCPWRTSRGAPRVGPGRAPNKKRVRWGVPGDEPRQGARAVGVHTGCRDRNRIATFGGCDPRHMPEMSGFVRRF